MSDPHTSTLLTRLATEKSFDNVEILVERVKDAKIALPEGMSLKTAILRLADIMKQDDQITQFKEDILCFPLDGAHALMKVLKIMFGWVSAKPTPGFFGPNPPRLLELDISPTEKVPVIWGGFQVPTLEAQINCGGEINNSGQAVFFLSGKCKQGELPEIRAIARLVREYVREYSVYRGKAIRLEVDDDGELQLDVAPTFLDTKDLGGAELILNEGLDRQLRAHLFVPIMYTEAVRKARVPLKRGILFEGPYGVGKTLAAFKTAAVCEANGWTFIYVKSVEGFAAAISFAQQYLPAVVFSEDIDQVLGSDERDEQTNEILNILDGIDSKSHELMVIFTTNHVEKLNKALMRPGRLDTVISVAPPDSTSVEKLIRHYGRELVSDKLDLTQPCASLAGQIPAVIREAVESSKLYAFERLTHAQKLKYAEKGVGLTLDHTDLEASAQDLLHQREVIAGKHEEPEIPMALALENERNARIDVVEEAIEKMSDTLDIVKAAVGA